MHFNPAIWGCLGFSKLSVAALFLSADPRMVASHPQPSALERAVQERLRLSTGLVEWQGTRAPKNAYPERVRRYTSRFAGESFLQITHGDGVSLSDDGTDATPYKPRMGLVNGDGLWRHREDALEAYLHSRRAPAIVAYDPRSLGMFAWNEHRPVREALAAIMATPGVEYSERVDAGLFIARARSADGTREWHIDPKRGWSVVRAASYDAQGALVTESRTEVAQCGGSWFPERVVLYSNAYQECKEPVEVIDVLHAELNEPDQPTVLGPEHIGIEAGVMVNLLGDSGHPVPGQPATLRWWDGSKLVTQDQFWSSVEKGELEPGERVKRRLAELRERRGHGESESPSKPIRPGASPSETQWTRETVLSVWEQYTLDFIREHQLEPVRTRGALEILDRCQKRGRKYLDAKSSELSELERRMAGATAGSSPEELHKKARDLRAPIDRIFEQELKPRLNGLLERRPPSEVAQPRPPAP